MNESAALLPLIFSLLSLGFFGGFSHCLGMCGPFVVSQVSARLQDVTLEKFSNFERLKNLALLPYHFGRITTYCLIGFSCSALGSMTRNFDSFRYASAVLLVVAALTFLKAAMPSWKFMDRRRKHFVFLATSHLFQVLRNISDGNTTSVRHKTGQKIKKIISVLFQNPRGWRGYILGILLGFIPCGLLYGAFAICTTIANPFFAAFAMFCFGFATFPALFLSGSGGYFLIKHSGFKFITKAVLLLNAIMLLMMAVRLI